MLVRFFNVCLWMSAAVIFCFVWGFLIEPTQTKIRQHIIELEQWEGEPLKIVFFADLHIGGAHVAPRRVAALVDIINAQKADLVLMAGDFIDGSGARSTRTSEFNLKVDQGIKKLSHLRPQTRVFATLGNHDALHGNRNVKDLLVRANVRVLNNQVGIRNQQYCIVGLADEWYGRPNPDIIDRCPEGAAVIAFMHSPDTFIDLPAERTSIALAGHTHGGQIKLPILGFVFTATKLDRIYAYGRNNYRNFPVFVTAGIGTSGLGARFRAPPEIAVIQIQSAKP